MHDDKRNEVQHFLVYDSTSINLIKKRKGAKPSEIMQEVVINQQKADPILFSGWARPDPAYPSDKKYHNDNFALIGQITYNNGKTTQPFEM